MVYALLIAAAVALLATLHLLTSRRGGASRLALPGGTDPWARFLVAAALGATLFALGVIAVPALIDDDDEVSGTTSEPTTTIPTTTASSTTAPDPTTSVPTTAPTATTTTSTATTTSVPTAPTTTTTPPPPEGKIVLARATVDGPTGQLVGSVSRLGAPPSVRRVGDGIYRVVVPGLSQDARKRTTVRIRAGTTTEAAVRRPAGTEALIVLTTSSATGAAVSRDFTIVLWGARSDIPKLPKTT